MTLHWTSFLWITGLFAALVLCPAPGFAQVAVPRAELAAAAEPSADGTPALAPSSDQGKPPGSSPAEKNPSLPEGSPRIMIGLTFPNIRMIGTDTLREAQVRQISSAPTAQFLNSEEISLDSVPLLWFVDIYLTPEWAVGFLSESVSGSRTSGLPQGMYFGRPVPAVDYTEKVTLGSEFVTGTWLPLRSHFARAGLLGGIGQTYYTYAQALDIPKNQSLAGILFGSFSCINPFNNCSDDHGTNVYSDSESVSTVAWLGGAFVELGWPGFALRGGYNYIGADLPHLKAVQPIGTQTSFTVAGSHASSFVALRIGFSE